MSDATLAALRAFPDQLEAHYALIPATHKHWTPASWEGVPSEALTAIEQVCHVRDIEIEGYHHRFERTLAEEKPFLRAIDTGALVRDRRYGESNAARALADFRAARATTLSLLERLTPAQFGRSAVFEGYGPVTLRGLVHFLCSHDQQHLAGLQWLLGKIESGEVAGRNR
jgi:DinB superfamily